MAAQVDLATTYRELYRAKFRADVEAGTARPLVLPLQFLGIWIIPTLYLAIPHTNRPWLYRARWLVLAFVVVFHWHMIQNVSSLNFASAYGAGLLAAWGTVWNFTLLVWTRPQWDARRVDIRRKKIKKDERCEDVDEKERGGPSALVEENGHAPHANDELRRSHTGASPELDGNVLGSHSKEQDNGSTTTGMEANGYTGTLDGPVSSNAMRERQTQAKAATSDTQRSEMSEEARKEMQDTIESVLQRGNNAPHDQKPAVDLDKLGREQEYEYYWQDYPVDASFWTRLDWAFDIVSTLRMTGWNWAIPCLPPYRVPPSIGNYQLPLEFGPHRSKQGFTRTLSRRDLFVGRMVVDIIPNYFIVDMCAVFMTEDPYFILGPNDLPLPPHLAALSPLLLSLRRTTLSLVAVVSALHLMWNLGALCIALLCPPVLGLRANPWHLPTMSGSFTNVLDRGLAGFWGGWWHQTFRFGFSAPCEWLLRRGHLRRGTAAASAAAAACAFLQSGFLHGAASYTAVPDTKWWLPPLFFLLSGVGTTLQAQLARALRAAVGARAVDRLPRWARRAANLAFVLGWLWLTSWTLLDDFGRAGLWLYEPVPVSVFRWLGYGSPGDRAVWRYGRDSWPRWYTGRHWWESGFGI